MRRIICIVVIALFAIAVCGCSVSEEDGYPKPTERFFVNDFAEVMDSADEDEIFSRSAALAEKTEAQVVVITVNTLNEEEPADYALNIGREWGVGSEDENNGIVVLFAKEERQIYIAVGYGLEGALPDSKTGRIIDVYGLDSLKADEFSKGITSITKALINEVYIEYNLEPEEGYVPIDEVSDVTELDDNDIRVIFAIIIIAVLFFALFGRRRGLFWFGGPGGPRGGFGGGFSGGSRGGFGGGGFSGGGGSFGGGGAGRGF